MPAISSEATNRKGTPSCAGRLDKSRLIRLEIGRGQQPHLRQFAAGLGERAADSRHDGLGAGSAPTAHAHDQVLGRLGGGGDDRLGAEHIGHGDGQLVGAPFVPADEADGPAAANIDHHHAGIGRLVLKARGDRPDHQADRRDVDQPVEAGENLPRQIDDALESPAAGHPATSACRKTSQASHGVQWRRGP